MYKYTIEATNNGYSSWAGRYASEQIVVKVKTQTESLAYLRVKQMVIRDNYKIIEIEEI